VSNTSDDLPEPDTPVTTSNSSAQIQIEPLEVILARAADSNDVVNGIGHGCGQVKEFFDRQAWVTSSPQRAPFYRPGIIRGPRNRSLRSCFQKMISGITPFMRFVLKASSNWLVAGAALLGFLPCP